MNDDMIDQMYQEGKNALEDELADKVQHTYDFYRKDLSASNNKSILYTADVLNLTVEQVKKYLP